MQQKILKIIYNKQQFSNALNTLEEAIQADHNNPFLRDATIQRFEYTYETAWKLMRSIFVYKNVRLNFVGDIFREALSLEWIKNHEVWDKMIEDRNLTSHTYKERTAIEVYETILEEYYPAFLFFKEQIMKVVEEIERAT